MELKVYKLAASDKYKEDVLEPQDVLQGFDSDSNSRSQNLEELTGMGFDENNYIPIPPVGKAASQQGTPRLTSTPKLMVGADLNILDPTHNRGKVNRINSFTAVQEQVEMVTKQSKRGQVESPDTRGQTQPSTSIHGNTGR